MKHKMLPIYSFIISFQQLVLIFYMNILTSPWFHCFSWFTHFSCFKLAVVLWLTNRIYVSINSSKSHALLHVHSLCKTALLRLFIARLQKTLGTCIMIYVYFAKRFSTCLRSRCTIVKKIKMSWYNKIKTSLKF